MCGKEMQTCNNFSRGQCCNIEEDKTGRKVPSKSQLLKEILKNSQGKHQRSEKWFRDHTYVLVFVYEYIEYTD